MQATVTVQKVYPPKNNPNFGSIKTAEMGYVSVPREKLGGFYDGMTAEIEYKTTPTGYHNLVRQIVQNQATNGPSPGAGSAGNTAPRRASGTNSDMLMFVTGVVGRSMQSGNFGINDIKQIAAEARRAYEQYLGPQASPSQDQAAVPTQTRPMPPSVRTVGQAVAASGWRDTQPRQDIPDAMDDEIPF